MAQPRDNVLQHWLPACYLQFFTAEHTRYGTLYAIGSDGKWRQTTPHAECKSKNFYRADLPQADDPHTQHEALYPPIVLKAMAGKSLSVADKFRLLSFMVHLHVRNPGLRADTSQVDRLILFCSDFDTVMSSLLNVSEFSERSVTAALNSRWDIRILSTGQKKILTSDNPAVFYKSKNHRRIFITLPISPRHICIAADRRRVRFLNNTFLPKDVQFIQGAMYGQRERFAFIDQPGDVKGSVGYKMSEDQRGLTTGTGLSTSDCIYGTHLSCLRHLRL